MQLTTWLVKTLFSYFTNNTNYTDSIIACNISDKETEEVFSYSNLRKQGRSGPAAPVLMYPNPQKLLKWMFMDLLKAGSIFLSKLLEDIMV